MSIDLSVIIISYNTADLIVDCVKSVLRSVNVNLEIFVVDNASQDNTLEVLRNSFKSLNLVANKENRGFGAANNQVLYQCAGRYIVFLNPDTIVKPNTFFTMVAYMDSNPDVGLAGPKVVNPDETRQDSVSYRYPGYRYGKKDLINLPGEIACVLGACQIISSALLKDVNGFDEDFFLYGEDQDLCLRIRKKGYRIGFIDNTSIVHLGGQSERKTPPEEVVRKKCIAEQLFFSKHYSNKSIRKIYMYKILKSIWMIFNLKTRIVFSSKKTVLEIKLRKYIVTYNCFNGFPTIK